MAKALNAPPPGTLIHATRPLSGGNSIFRLVPAAFVSVLVHAGLVALLVFVLEAPSNARPQLEKAGQPLDLRTVRAPDKERARPDFRSPTAPEFSAKEPGSAANYKSPVKAPISVPGIADPLQQPGLKDGSKEKELADVPKGFGFKTKDGGAFPLPEIPGLESPSGSGLPKGLDPQAVEKFAGGPLGGTGSQRDDALREYGGDNESEVAVNRALEFLKRTQLTDGKWKGSWKVIHDSFPADEKKKYTTPTLGDDIPITALALLAFVSRGCTEEEKISNGKGGLIDNPYQGVVKSAAEYLAKQVNDKTSALTLSARQETYEYYGVVTLALCELYLNTRDPKRKEHLQYVVGIAVRLLKERQTPDGGWTHQNAVKGEGHVIPTGWAVQALRTAQMAGFVKADDPVLDKARLFVESMVDAKTQGFRYTKDRKQPEHVPTVVGLLNRMHLGGVAANFSGLAVGVDNYVFRVGADFKGPDWSAPEGERHKVFYWFYGTQAMFHLGGEHWKAWNWWMRDYFLRQHKQVADDGPLDGSWDPVDTGEIGEVLGGRMLRTCLAVLTLEIYYRQVPLHLRDLQ